MAGAEGKKGCLVIAAAVVVLALVLLRGPIVRSWRGRAFDPAALRGFAGVGFARGEGSVGPDEAPYRRGKVLLLKRGVMDRRGVAEIDPPFIVDDWYDLDAGVRAASPAEVKTLIVCETGLASVGFYVPVGQAPTVADSVQATQKAKRHWVRLSVYDLERKILVGEASIDGAMPKDLISAGESHVGARADIAAYVRGMPVR